MIRDDPLKLDKPQINLGEGFEQISSGSLGEFTFYIIGKKFVDELHAEMLSYGWGNDYFFLYGKDDRDILISYSVWDSEKDAGEFLEGWKKVIESKYPMVTWTDKDKGVSLAKSSDCNIYLAREADKVLVIESEVTEGGILDRIAKKIGFAAFGIEDNS